MKEYAPKIKKMALLCSILKKGGLEMYGSMYILFAMASFYVEGANLLVPSRVNFNFKRVLSPFTSFFKGFIGAASDSSDILWMI